MRHRRSIISRWFQDAAAVEAVITGTSCHAADVDSQRAGAEGSHHAISQRAVKSMSQRSAPPPWLDMISLSLR